MNIHEYQAKQLLKEYGAPVADGRAITRAEEAKSAAGELDGPLWVVKAQIHAGGRGKGSFKEESAGPKGGVRLAKSVEEAAENSEMMLGRTLVTHQTGPVGKQVNRIYIEDGADIETELYLAMLVDRETSRVSFIASTEGGMDIEEVAEASPEKIVSFSVDPASGISSFHGRKVVAITGDGGFGQYMGELNTAVKYGMNITHVLLNNAELGKISKEQRAGQWDVWETSLHNPDFARYAELCGALGVRVTKAEALDAALEAALAHPGPSLVEVVTDPMLI